MSRLNRTKPVGKKSSVGKGTHRDKFQKRNSNVLEKTYKEKDERSSAFGNAKDIWNDEALKELGITIFKPSVGENFMEVLPLSYDANIPYFFELAIHYGVGINKDAFVCPKRFDGSKCYRCEVQQKMYKSNSGTSDELKALYPTDRCLYLVWNRTEELGEKEEDQTYKIQLWAAPKTKIHSEIQSKVRNKKTKECIDISDVSEDGEGRTVYFDYTLGKKKNDFPSYSGIELIERDDPIPDEILEKLDEIYEFCEQNKFKHNPLEALIEFADYDAIKESMMTEYDEEDDDDEKSKKGSRKKSKKKSDELTEEEALEQLEELKEQLEELSPIKFKKWCKENNYFDKLEEAGIDPKEDRDDAIEFICDDRYTQMMEPEDDIPY